MCPDLVLKCSPILPSFPLFPFLPRPFCFSAGPTCSLIGEGFQHPTAEEPKLSGGGRKTHQQHTYTRTHTGTGLPLIIPAHFTAASLTLKPHTYAALRPHTHASDHIAAKTEARRRAFILQIARSLGRQ